MTISRRAFLEIAAGAFATTAGAPGLTQTAQPVASASMASIQGLLESTEAPAEPIPPA